MSNNRVPRLPSEVSNRTGTFDRFAGAASTMVSRAWFFVLCVTLVVVWAPSILVFRNLDTWQLVINTATTIVTFLLVALLQNTQTRSDQAVQHKLNALAQAMGDLMEHLEQMDGKRDLRSDREELQAAVGLESYESTSDNADETQAETHRKNPTVAGRGPCGPDRGGEMPRKSPGPSIKDKEMYESMREEGASKEKAARVSNAAAARGRDEVGRKGGHSGDYEDWSVDDLRERAKELGIEGRSDLTKDELIHALRHH